jgi:transcriptional regulator GlxA family with amidase domain
MGTQVATRALDDGHYDTVIIGGDPVARTFSPPVLAFLQRVRATAQHVAGPCTGAFALAEAGLLDGRRATTHWGHARELQQRFPNIRVDEDRIFVSDGGVWTSAGMTAGIDMALAIVEADLGVELARDVARRLVMYHRRPGGQSQFSALLDLEPKSDRIQMALDFARRNLRRELSVEELAGIAGLSPRQFSRAFRSETRESPAKAVERLRVEAARQMIQDGRLSIDEVARETGLVDRNRLRRSFLRIYSVPPQAIRRQVRMALAHEPVN